MRGNSRMSDRNEIKTTGSRPTLGGDERTNCSRHKHLVLDAGLGTSARLLPFYVPNILVSSSGWIRCCFEYVK